MRILLKLLFLLILCSCKVEGTDTGNPGLIGDPQIVVEGSVISDLTGTICTRLSQCQDETLNDCFGSVFDLTNIDIEIGLRPGAFADLGQVHTAVINQVLTPDYENFEICANQIETLECNNALLKNAYNQHHPQPYFGVAAMLPQACRLIF